MSKQYSVFVSYADEDDAWVEGYLLNALEEAGLTCHSEAMFRLGVPRLIEFESAVKNSERTLLVISPAYLADNFVEFANLLSLYYGFDTHLWPVVGIILHPVQELSMRLKILECLDATDATKQQKAIQRICKDFQKPVPTLATIPDCPYPGMRPFKPEDSDRFFGRQREINDLIQHLRLYPFLAVIGASGSGKSSLIFAGLIPQLQTTHLLGKEKWQIYSMRPGTTPITTLTATLGCDPTSAEAITTKFNISQKFLLFIDQFEEIFTLSPQDVTPFQEILLNLYKQPNFYVVLTVRADFYPQLMESTCFWREIKAHRYEVLPLDQAGLQEAILKPAEQANVFIESALLERLIITAAREPGVLPLLQETLVLLWEKIERRYLPLRAYEALVLSYHNAVSNTNNKLTGIQVAIAQRADAAIANLTDEQQIIARRVFLRLIQFGEGRADTRRQESVEALKARGDNDQIFEETLRYLADRRLLTLSGKEDKTRKVDISHEILISSWPQLQDWIIQRRDAEQTRRRLIAKVEEWVRLGKGQGGLLDEFEIVEAQHWLDSSDAIELGSDDQLVALVELSKTAIEDEKQQKSEAQERELALIRERLEQEKIANNNKQKALKAEKSKNRTLIVSLLLMAGLTAFSAYQTLQARLQTINALSESSQALFADNQDLDALMKSIKAGKMVKEISFLVPGSLKIKVLTELNQVLYNIRETNRLEDHTDAVISVSFSPDRQTIASSSRDKTIKLWTADGQLIKSLSGHEAEIYRVIFSPNGQTLASASADKTIKLWSKEGDLLRTISAHDLEVYDVSFHPTLPIIASASADKSIKLWDAETGKFLHQILGHTDEVISVSFSPDGDMIASASADKTIKIWNAKDRTLIKTLTGHQDKVLEVSFSPDGDMIASASADKTIKLWRTKDGKLIKTLTGHQDKVLEVDFSPDSKMIASASADNTIKLWKVKNGELLQTLEAHKAPVVGVRFSPDGKTLASASTDQTIRLWRWEGIHPQLLKHNAPVMGVSFSPNGQIIASASQDTTIKLWKPNGDLLHILKGHTKPVIKVRFSPDGEMIASASSDKTVKLWNKNGDLLQTFQGHNGKVVSVSINSQHKMIASGSEDGTIKLWKLDGTLIKTLNVENPVWDVTFSPDGNTLVSGSKNGNIQFWSLEGSLIKSINAHEGSVTKLTFSPNGQILASASMDGTIKLWKPDGESIPLTNVPRHNMSILDINFTPDGQTIASASFDQTIKLWDLAGNLLQTIPETNYLYGVSLSPDSQTLASASQDNLVVLRNLNLEKLLLQSCNWSKGYIVSRYHKEANQSNLCKNLIKNGDFSHEKLAQ
ncbi:nSTAND1 domain-containing NTPase [Planktothrix agardhii]|uniref:nSTAND1 domain-containing NTPase n=1 Tax=Planktothrix agardhii TaxID=1160 RepID=UPI001D09C51E|nr:TIR domain-containing protein [Planktothrix agardhii]MCB8749527.1 TIR domain-containing protein [Planktothrix agardhii 1810]MCF3605513.1 TIR domain-containing protein [Planktothrix agardhii 1033]